jgi:alpha/beta superfamily hydrolase
VILTAEQAFREAGHTTLLFNFRGVGASEGVHGEGRTEVADVAGALAFLRRSLGAPDKVAGGGKTGAPAAGTGPGGARGPDGLGAGAAAPSGGPPALAVAGYSFGSYVGARAAAADPGVGFYLGIAPVTSRYDYGVLAGFRGRLALIGGTRDEFGPRDQLEALAARLPGPPWLRILDADHFFEGAMPELAAACREAIAVAA